MQQDLLPQDVDLPTLPSSPQASIPFAQSTRIFPEDDEPSSFTSPWDSATRDEDDDVDDEFCGVGLQEFPVFINEDLTLKLLQAPTAFRGVEHDETGTVVWGASVCLARFLAASPTLVQHHSTTLELGCGCGLPSLVVAAQSGAARVVATDMEDGTLQQLEQVARLNSIGPHQLELFKLNWKDHDETLEKADLILASDVIYHNSMVPPLVKTIERYLAKGGKAYLALRNTRQGVSTLWQEAMPAAGFHHMESISCQEYLDDAGLDKNNEATGHRFRGDHTIYVFQRKETMKE